MTHRLIIIFLGLGIIAAIVGGMVYWEWPSSWPPQTGSVPAESAEGPPAMLRTPSLYPAQISAGEQILITVSIFIPEDTLIPSSVNLERMDAGGRVLRVIGSFRNDGTSGDESAGDRTFTIQMTLNEAVEGVVNFRVSAGFQGVMKQVQSPMVSVQVNPYHDADETLRKFISLLAANNLEAASQMVSGDRRAAEIRALSPSGASQLAEALSNSHLLESTQNSRTYLAPAPPGRGTGEVEFWLVRSPRGEWKIRL